MAVSCMRNASGDNYIGTVRSLWTRHIYYVPQNVFLAYLMRSICSPWNSSKQTSLQCLSTINMVFSDEDKILTKKVCIWRGTQQRDWQSNFLRKLIIIIINEFHRDASLAKLQGRCVSRVSLVSMVLLPVVCVAVWSTEQFRLQKLVTVCSQALHGCELRLRCRFARLPRPTAKRK